MNYYLVFLCNWPAQSNAIVRSVELTTSLPTYVKSTNDYVYVDLSAHLASRETKIYGTTVQEVTNRLVQRVGGLSINKQASTTVQVLMGDVRISDDTPASRRLTSWNDVVKPALQRSAHTSAFGSL